MKKRVAILAACCGMTGCFGPDIPEGLMCGPGGACPLGQQCDESAMTCVAAGTPDAGQTAASFCDDPDISLCLPFDDGLDDQSPSDRVVTRNGAVGQMRGVLGLAADFDGASWLQVDSYRPGTPEETIEMWFDASVGDAPPQYLIASTASFELRIEGGLLHASSGNNTLFSVFPQDRFVHVAIRVRDGSFSYVVDGVAEGSAAFQDGEGDPALAIGSNFGTDHLVGQIDQLRVWTRRLTNDEIEDIADQ